MRLPLYRVCCRVAAVFPPICARLPMGGWQTSIRGPPVVCSKTVHLRADSGSQASEYFSKSARSAAKAARVDWRISASPPVYAAGRGAAHIEFCSIERGEPRPGNFANRQVLLSGRGRLRPNRGRHPAEARSGRWQYARRFHLEERTASATTSQPPWPWPS